jgi:glutamine synthetase
MQPFIEEHPKLPIVLLHASYPFTREAGYLASVYENVYLDVGEVFPMVSREGQERVIAHALELCPSVKLLWSTDGHWFPETYLLAVIQVREALERVLSAYVRDGTLEEQQAIRIVEDLFFRTANTIYRLELSLSLLEHSTSSVAKKPVGEVQSEGFDIAPFTRFLEENPTIKYIRLQWLDYTSTLRGRILTVKQALKLFEAQEFVGITMAVLGLLQEDMTAPGFNGVGAYDLVPSFTSLRRGEVRKLASYATVQCEFRDGVTGAEVSICPRTALRKIVEKAARAKAVECLVGFELEVVFMRYERANGQTVYGGTPVSYGHAWSAIRALHSPEMMEVLETILDALETAGITVQQFHPETAPGQYEIVTDPLPPLEAVDTLLATRDIISAVSANYSLRATFIPKPIPGAAGTGAHMHISLTNYSQAYYKTFYAGVLKHLQAIAAFTYSNEMSYERAVGGVWAGGRYITWGTQNREAPLRKIKDSHWELKALDGFANMYLVLAAFLAAGLQGLHDKTEMKWKDCQADPETLDDAQRKELGIDSMLPSSFQEAMEFLRKDTELKELLGEGVVDTYLNVKTAEAEMLAKMNPEKRRHWLIERY